MTNENPPSPIPPWRPRASTIAKTNDARKPILKSGNSEPCASTINSVNPVKIGKGLDCLKRSEDLVERLRGLSKPKHASKAPILSASKQSTMTIPPPKQASTKPSALAALASFCEQCAAERRRISPPKHRNYQTTGQSTRKEIGGHGISGLIMCRDMPASESHDIPQSSSDSDVVQPAYPLPPLDQVTDAQLSRYARLIYERTGIHVSPQKKMLLSNRLRRRLRQTGICNFDGYYRYLKGLSNDHPEWDEFFQEITTHETYLFRDENQWEWFSDVYLKQHISTLCAQGNSRRLRIWSAACSTGDEVYTIACCVAASLPNLSKWQVDILGTDIAAGEIRHAQQPVFAQRAMRLVPKEYLHYFEQDENSEDWTPKPVLRQMVRFEPHNLMSRLQERPFDVVFLKNVLIYFDKESKKQALQNVSPLIRPGGLLVAGAAEGVAGLIHGFKRLEPWLFQRIQ